MNLCELEKMLNVCAKTLNFVHEELYQSKCTYEVAILMTLKLLL